MGIDKNKHHQLISCLKELRLLTDDPEVNKRIEVEITSLSEIYNRYITLLDDCYKQTVSYNLIFNEIQVETYKELRRAKKSQPLLLLLVVIPLYLQFYREGKHSIIPGKIESVNEQPVMSIAYRRDIFCRSLQRRQMYRKKWKVKRSLTHWLTRNDDLFFTFVHGNFSSYDRISFKR